MKTFAVAAVIVAATFAAWLHGAGLLEPLVRSHFGAP